MKILILNFEYPPLGGGGGVATKQIAEELASRHEVFVITSGAPGCPAAETANGVNVIRVPVFGRKELPTATFLSMLSYVFSAFVKGLAICKREKFDVLNAQFVLPSGVPAVLLSKIFNIPFVLSFIGGDIYDPTKSISPHRHGILRAVIRWIAGHAVICTAISEDTKRRTQQIHKVAKEIVVTPLGIVPQAVSPATREVFDIPKDAIVAVSIGRLIPRKGYMSLLAAWKDISNAQLFILGDGPLMAKMAAFIKENQLENRVRLLGFVSEEEKLQLLRLANMYVSAAKHEGFGIVFIEAMDAGLPIVATNDGGQRDFLSNDNALLVPPDTTDAITKAINTLIDDQPLRTRMGDANRQKAKSFYIDKTTAQFEEVLERAVHEGNG